MKFIKFCNTVIEYAFYALFLFVPLIFTGNTSELFEFNKMWLTFGLTIIITTSWIGKMIIERKITIKRTPLDIPLTLFLLSQIISTIFSLDTHVSIWGYYSRFNGGLLSTITYILLYYAFITNLSSKQAVRTLIVTVISGCLVALWGFPSHFGYDPTCLMFRGTFDTSCWTDAFKPTIRSFSTLGQPAWLAAYLSIVIPLAVAYAGKQYKEFKNNSQKLQPGRFIIFLLLAAFLYANLIFSDTRAGFIGFWIGNLVFWGILFLKNILDKKMLLRYFLITNLAFLILNFFFGSPISQLDRFTLPQLTTHAIAKANAQSLSPQPSTTAPPPSPQSKINITDSGQIRLLVWKGAIAAWKDHPLFGTGVETFAYAYYLYRPKEHNMTSEWDYLYNKAHNEYLNYLATTGIFGLGTYLVIIGFFFYQFTLYLFKPKDSYVLNPKSYVINISLLAGFISILVSNFFGFSVVIINLYFFLIPAFVFLIGNLLNHQYITIPILPAPKTNPQKKNLATPLPAANAWQWTAVLAINILAGYLILALIQYWFADVAYALGSNLDKVGQYQQAYPQLIQAVQIEPTEPVYKDELAVNLATLATGLMSQKDATDAAQFAQNAVALNNQITTNHPNNVLFWKNRVRIFYSLAQTDPKNQQTYLSQALEAMQKSSQLAPTDAKIAYNLGVLYGQTGDLQKGIATLQNTIYLKPDYRDAYYALAVTYHEAAIDKNKKVTDSALEQKAIDTMNYILNHFDPNDKDVHQKLAAWSAGTE